MVFCIAFSRGWSHYQMGVNNALYHGRISEDIYITQPPGFVHSQLPTMFASCVHSGNVVAYFLVYADDLLLKGAMSPS